MSDGAQIDIPLLVIGLMLVATLAAFAVGIFPYPFGFFILGAIMLARYLQLKSRR